MMRVVEGFGSVLQWALVRGRRLVAIGVVLAAGGLGLTYPPVLAQSQPGEPQLTYTVSDCLKGAEMPDNPPVANAGPNPVALGTGCQKSIATGLGPIATFSGFNRNPGVKLSVTGDRLHFAHRLVYNCCTALKIEHRLDRSTNPPTLAIIEREVRDSGGGCRCDCPYDVSGTISPLAAGVYRVTIEAESYLNDSVAITDQSITVPAAEPPDPTR